MSSHQISRRSVARGAAWAAPVVAIAVAAPAFAASPTYVPPVTAVTGCQCGNGGGQNKPYRLNVTFTNTSSWDFAITLPVIGLPNDTASNVILQPTPAQTNVILANTVTTLRYTFTRGNNGGSQVSFTCTATNQTTFLATTHTTPLMPITWGTCTSACV